MYIYRSLQESGTSIVDFSEPVSCDILSEDESVLNTYLVTVDQQQVDEEEFSSTNVITANNDGHNDYWIIQNAFIYNDHIFKIFDVNGRIIYESIGYRNDWDGSFKGKKVDRGKYYYLIQNRSTGQEIKGSILVIY
jgi:gliding motility-associated-like protein